MEFNASDKYNSMIRSYKKLEKIQTNNGNEISNTDSRDAVENFFNQCYHLKDWLKKDTKIKLILDIENYVNNSINLSLASDYCNTFKHAGLDKKSKSGKTLDKINTHIKFDLTSAGFVASSKLEITIDGQKHDAFDLATKCLDDWNNFLKLNNIVFK